MIRFITGLPGSGKSSRIRDLLSDALHRGLDCVLLVPEQQAVLWERELAAVLPPSAWLHLELTNFTRLANTVFRTYGGLTLPKIDDGGQTLILWRALLSVYDSLQAYGHVTGDREDKNLPTLAAAIAELKQNGITPAMASRAAEILSDDGECTHFAARFSDVSLIYAAYEEILHTEYSDREDVMDALCRTLAEHPYFAGKAVFVDSFYSVTVPETRILRTIMQNAAELSVTFACTRADSGDIPFLRIRKYLSQMERLAADTGLPVEWIECTEDHRHTTPGLTAITGGLYGSAPMKASAAVDEIAVTWCTDRYEEAEAVCAIVERLVAEGARYRDIAVAARDIGIWHGILDEALRRHEIPVFVAEADPLSKSAPVRLILSLCAVETGGYNRRDLCRMIDTGLTPLTDREADCFAAYTKTWNLHGRRAYLGDGSEHFVWNFNPDGYRVTFTDWGRRALGHANDAREKLLPAIGRFSDVFLDHEADVEAICRAVVTFCLELGVPERLDALASSQTREGRAEDGAKTASFWPAICSALDKMVSLLGGTMLDCGRFAGLFGRVIGAMEIGAIPTGLDLLSLGSADGVRFGAVRHMILLDCVEGVFPAPAEDAGFFRDIDRILLEGAGLSMPGKTGAESSAEEAFMFYRLACASSTSLHLLLPMKLDGETGNMAEPAARIVSELSVVPTHFGDWPLQRRMRHPAARLSFRNAAERRAAEVYREKYRAADTAGSEHFALPLSANDDHSDPGFEGALFGRSLTLSQSKIERYVSCPFGYFCTYGMALREEAAAEIGTPDIGMFVHAILEQFFRECAGRTYPIPADETEAIADRLIADYVRRLGITDSAGNGRLTYLFTRLRRHVLVFLDAVMQEFAQSRFVPAAFEVPMGGTGNEGGIASLRLPLGDGTEVSLTGIIDRVDIYTASDGRKYVRVVDYKTGRQKFSLDDIRDGLHVQLLLYLFTLWKGMTPFASEEGIVYPAGAVYLTVKPQEKPAPDMTDEVRAREMAVDSLTRSGIYLDDREILDAMDYGLSGKYVQIKEKKDGTLSGKDVLASMAQFGQLYTELSDTVKKIAAAITAGHSPAQPRRHGQVLHCAYCAMRPVCRYRKPTENGGVS